MPTACRQSSKKCVLRGRVVEMERLRIKFGCERLDLLLSHARSTGGERLSYCKVFEIPLAHANKDLCGRTHRRKDKLGLNIRTNPAVPDSFRRCKVNRGGR